MTTTKNPLCVVHRNCMDGLAAAWVVWQALDHEVEIVGMAYEERASEFPKLDLEDRDVIIADFSIPPAVLMPFAGKIRRLIMLDHHATMHEEWATSPAIPEHFLLQYSKTASGARLAWQHQSVIRHMVEDRTEGLLFKDIRPRFGPPPLAVRHIDDYDRWKFEIPNSKEFHYYLRICGFPEGRLSPKGLESFGELVQFIEKDESNFRACVYEGGRIGMRFEQATVREIITMYASYRDIRGYRIPVCAMPYPYRDDAGVLMSELMKSTFSLSYCDDIRLGYRRYSLRSTGFDVLPIAKHFGGGGHATSAGFSTALDSPLIWDCEANRVGPTRRLHADD